MATPSPTPLVLSDYEISDGAEAFHTLPRIGSTTFPADDLGDMNYWLYSIGASAAIPVVCFFLGVPLFWFFLCCRTGCCSCLCGKCKRCSDFLCGCCGKSVCCPDVSHIEKKGGLCSCMTCKKDPEKCMHAGLCHGKPLVARAVLIGLFIALGLVNIGVKDGMATLGLAADDLVSITDSIGDIFDELTTYGVDLTVYGGEIVNNSAILGSTCTYAATTDAVALMSPAGTSLEAAGDSIDSLIGSLADTVYTIADDIDEYTSGQYFALATLMMLFGAIYSGLGLVGAVCIELKPVVCRWSSNILVITQLVGLLLLFILSLVVAVEMGVGMVIGDFCAAGPTDVVVTLVDEAVNSNSSKIFDYFLKGEGSNPFDTYYDEGYDAGVEVNSTLTDYKPLFVSTTMCCDASSSVITSSAALSDYLTSCDFFYTSATDCTVNSACSTTAVPVGGCVAGAGCSASGYNGLRNNIEDVLLDQNGPIAGIFSLISFETLNTPLRRVLESALCLHTINGFYTLFSTHASVLMLTYLSMFVVSLLRASIIGTQCCFSGKNKTGTTEFNKTWELEGNVEMYDPNSLKNANQASSPEMRAQL